MTLASPTTAALGSAHLLVVDDDEMMLVVVRQTLELEGYQIVTAANGEEALAIARQQTFSVIISDQRMPGLSGLDFLAQIKEIQPDTTRILLTAVLELDTVIDAINKGEIYRFVVKPWLREELLVTVHNAVQRYQLIGRNRELQATTLAMNEKLVRLNQELAAQVARVEQQNQQLDDLNRALKQNLERSVELCLNTMETFYPTLGSQARRVHGLCQAMAQELRLSPEQRQVLEISAWLHDIGLVGVPRHLIKLWEQTPETLTEAERALVEQHPLLGQELAGFVHHLQAVGTTIRAHHELFNGSGFPDRLAGEQIPWLSRLLAVAVAYNEGSGVTEASVERVRQGSGSAFDPEAVRAFLKCLPRASIPRRQRLVMLSELTPGMILAKGIYTANGLLLIPDGQRLTEPYIHKLENHNRINPITQAFMVYC